MIPVIPLKTILITGTIVFVISSVGMGAWYITGLRADLAQSEANNSKLVEAVQTQKKTIAQIEKDVTRIFEANRHIAESINRNNRDIKSLRERFSVNADGSKRDIGKSARTNPKSVEAAINKGTANAARCMEIASGAPLTESEKNATLPSQINRECPALANPSYKQR